jgi:hypothetical protein
MTDHDLEWLGAQRPATALDPDRTAAARAALLAHVKPVPALPHRTPPPRVARRRRIVAAAAFSGVAVVAVLFATSGGGTAPGLATGTASAAPLVRLSEHVRAAAPPTGDATLVLHTNKLADGSSFTGADLYADDGDYFYAPTRAGLPAVVTADEKVDEDGSIARELQAATAALDTPLAEARTQMATAPLDPNAKPPSAASTAELQQLIARKKLLAAKQGDSWVNEKQTPEELEDGRIWSSSLDALIAGSGRPDVRAGVLRLLSTIPTVTVDDTTTDGRPTLQLTAQVFPQHYEEQLVIDADTGTPIRFIGGTVGQQPSVVVDYEVSRVTVADVAKE